MTLVTEPTLFDAPHAEPVDEQTASLLALIDGDPLHAEDRRTVVEAILATAADDGGRVDPNRLRNWLYEDGVSVASLRHKGVLEEIGWTTTTGSVSGNNGRPARIYRLVKRPT